MAVTGVSEFAPKLCSAKADIRQPSAEIRSRLKVGSAAAAVSAVGLAVLEVGASGFVGPPGEAEDPVRIRSPRESEMNSKFLNLISWSGVKLSTRPRRPAGSACSMTLPNAKSWPGTKASLQLELLLMTRQAIDP